MFHNKFVAYAPFYYSPVIKYIIIFKNHFKKIQRSCGKEVGNSSGTKEKQYVQNEFNPTHIGYVNVADEDYL